MIWLSTEIDNLSIKITSTSASAVREIDKLTKSLERLQKNSGLDSIAKSFDKIGKAVDKGLSKAPGALRETASAAKQFSHSTKEAADDSKKFGESLKHTLQRLGEFAAAAFGINAVSQSFASMLAAGREWDGISARFGEGFGEKADEVYAHVQRLQEQLYINDQAFMQYAGNFATLAKGFGVAEDAVASMSVGLTELGYDIYAKNNDFYTFEEAMRAVRSAIVGEVEPIRMAGISITEATLKEVAAANGITMSVENMTEAQKSMLRYKAMIDQAYASGTVGTFAQELDTGEGMARALKQQLLGLGQTIGGALMPVVSAILPYLQAFVNVLTMAVKAVAAFFGVEVKTPTWSSGMSDLSSSAGTATDKVQDTTDALGSAAKAAKKLKDYTMGFDELNIIQPQEESASGGGGGGGGVGGGVGDDLGLDFKSLWDDSIIDSATSKAKKLTEDMLAFVEKIKPYFDDIWDVVQAIALGIAGWKFTAAVTDIVDGLKAGGKIREWFKKNKIAVGVSLMLTGATLAFNGAYDLAYEGPTWENILKTVVGDALLVGGALLTFGTGPVGWTVAIGAVLITNLVGFIMGSKREAMEEAYGEIELTAEEIDQMARSLFDFDIEAQFDLVNTTLKNEASAADTLSRSVMSLEAATKPIELGVGLSAEDVSQLESKVKAVKDNINTMLAANEETISLAVTLVPPVRADGEDIPTELLKALNLSDETISATAADIGKQFTHWVSQGMTDGMSEYEQKMITEYRQWLSRISNALAQGHAQGEAMAKMQTLLSGLTRDSVMSVLDESNKLFEELEETYRELETQAYAAAQANVAALEESKAFYESQGNIVKAEEIQKQIDDANAALESWDIEASVKKSVDKASEPMKKMWIEKFRNIFEEPLKNFEGTMSGDLFQQWFENLTVGDWRKSSSVESLAENVKGYLDEVINQATGDPKILQAATLMEITSWDMLTDDVKREVYDMLVEATDPSTAQQILELNGFNTSALFADGIESGLPEVETAGGELASAVAEGMENNKPVVTDEVAAVMEAAGITAKTWAGSGGKTAAGAFNTSFKGGITANTVSGAVEGAFTGAETTLGPVANKFGSTIGGELGTGFTNGLEVPVNSALGTLERTLNGSLRKVNSISPGTTSISLDRYVTVGMMASGGYVDEGQLFIAREAGAEMVGSMNGHTAVANNDQIVEGIYQGVYNAVVSAMGQNAGGKTSNVNVYLDGKQITAAVEQRQRERGATIMTGGVTYGY